MTAGGGVEVLAVMGEVEQIGKHARIAVTADGDLPAARRAFERIANKLEGAGKARTAIAELIAADREYDEARALVDEGDACPWPEDFERLEAATARRASALASLAGAQ